MKKSYIGITDFTDPNQAHEMLNVFKDTEKFLMVGIMMSYKTLNGIETKWKDAWPAKEDIKNIFVSHPKAFNTLHYADYEGINILENLERATIYGGSNMHAIQLDMIWPDPEQVKAYHRKYPYVEIVLQVNGKAFDIVENRALDLIKKLYLYENSLSYVLLDKSMGKGLGMDANLLAYFLRSLTIGLPGLRDIGLAVAGGLGPKTLHLVKPLVEEFPDISIDAQGRLRPSGNALDPIDWGMAKEYLEKAVEMFK